MMPLYDLDEDDHHDRVVVTRQSDIDPLNSRKDGYTLTHPHNTDHQVDGFHVKSTTPEHQFEIIEDYQTSDLLVWSPLSDPERQGHHPAEQSQTTLKTETKSKLLSSRSSSRKRIDDNSDTTPTSSPLSLSDAEEDKALRRGHRKSGIRFPDQSRPKKFIDGIARRLQNRRSNRAAGNQKSSRRHRGYMRADDESSSERESTLEGIEGKRKWANGRRAEDFERVSVSSGCGIEMRKKWRRKSNKDGDRMVGSESECPSIASRVSNERMKDKRIYRNGRHVENNDDEEDVGVDHRDLGRRSVRRDNSHSSRTIVVRTDEDDEDEEDAESLDKVPHRIAWLIALLILQSFSGIILEAFESLIRHHPVVVVFLTMLIGSGGNAGSQSTVLIIRRLATGKLKRRQYLSTLWEQFVISCLIAIVLAIVCFLRVYFFESDPFEVLAVCVSMGVIVISSVMLGTGLPMLFHLLKIDPAHANAAVQVLMDIVGVTLICLVSNIILDRMAPVWDPTYLQRQALREQAEQASGEAAKRFLARVMPSSP